MFERLHRRLVTSVLLWDVVLTLFCLYSTSTVRVWLDIGLPVSERRAQIPWHLYPAVACTWTAVFLLLRPQRALFFNTFIEAAGRLMASVALGAIVFAGLLYLSFRELSRLQFLYFAAINFIVLLLVHLAVRFFIQVRTRNGLVRRVLIVGWGAEAQHLVREFRRRPWANLTVVGCATDNPHEASGVPVFGPIRSTPRIVAEQRIDEVVFVSPEPEQVAQLSLELQHQPVMLHMVPGVLDLAFARTLVETLGGIPLVSLRESTLTEPQRVLKRVFDIVGSAVLLLLFSPVMAVIAIAIKLESAGPVFFLQERIGEHGRRFKMVKFRSMCQDAEARWKEVAVRQENGQLLHKRDDDPRITSIGRKLRRTSLDELPQLINVLRGEMSLVGPRPEMPYMAAEYVPWQWQRFRVPPGMTGWWQVNGRSGKPMHLHTEDDLYYIQNYSFWLDLKILWMTVGTVVKGRGAF